MQNKIDIKKNYLVKEDRFLVHKMKYSNSPTATKVIACWMAMVRKDDKKFLEYSISAKELSEIIGSDIRASHLKKIQKELIISTMSFFDEDMGEYRSLTVFKEIRYNPNTFRLTAIFHEDMKPYFIEFNNHYLKYGIDNILLLKSGYLIRLYKICRDEVTKFLVPVKNTHFELSIDDMREAFNIPDSYQYSSHIKKNILDNAVTQFKELTDIEINYSEKKEGRKVISVFISVTRKDSLKAKNKPKPYLQFRDSLLNIDMLNEEYRWDDATDGVYGFDLLDDYTAIIDTNKEKVYLGDEQGVYIDDRKAEELGITIDEVWQKVFSRKSEIEEKFNY